MSFGIVILLFGIKGKYDMIKKSKDYESVDGVFIGKEIYSSKTDERDETETTYSLIYSYNVNDEEYMISTDYGTSTVPKMESTRIIKYNPDNPGEAIISGFGANEIILILGFVFTILPLFMLGNSHPNKG